METPQPPMNAKVTCVIDMSERSVADNTPVVSRSDPRVLFVDDEPHVLEGVRLALRNQPYQVQTTTRAEAALEMQRERSFDVIVADECMPGMPGSELLTVVAREYPSVGRIVLTGHATVEAAARAINGAGVTRYLLKPCSPEELGEAIEAALRVRSSWKGAAVHSASEEPGVHPAVEGRAAARLQGALAAHEVLLHAQKVVSLSQPAVAVGYSLVARVEMQGGRVLTLPEFVSAGRADLSLSSLDRRLVRYIVQTLYARGRRTPLCSELTVSVNMSAQSADDADFFNFLHRELGGLDLPKRVLIEFPEEAAVRCAQSGAHLLGSIRNSGYRLCVDGVGPDLKRLAALRHLPVGMAKIDGQLVREVLTNPRAEKAVRSIVEFALTAGITTAARCVDTIALAEHLRKLGVELGQGHAFGPAESFASLVARLDR